MRILLFVIAIALVLVALSTVTIFLIPVDWLRENGFPQAAMATEMGRREISDAWNFSAD